MPSDIQLKTPDAVLAYEFEWANEVPAGVSLESVVHSAPTPLGILDESFDAIALTSKVRINGGVHAGLYVVTALATLSTGELVSSQFTLRVMQQPNFTD